MRDYTHQQTLYTYTDNMPTTPTTQWCNLSFMPICSIKRFVVAAHDDFCITFANNNNQNISFNKYGNS